MKRKCYIVFFAISAFLLFLPFGMVKADTCEAFEYSVNSDGEVTIIKYTGESQNVRIPDTIDGYRVCYLGNGAFLSHQNMKTVTFPSTLKTIGGYAFYDCGALEELSLPEGILYVGTGAFSYCKSLRSVKIPKSLHSIEEEVFFACESLSYIEVAGGNTTLYSEHGVLFQKEGLETNLYQYPAAMDQKVYRIPDRVTVILSGAFAHAKNLEKVYFANNSVYIAEEAFDATNRNLILYGEEQSTAKEYADKNGMVYDVEEDQNQDPEDEKNLEGNHDPEDEKNLEGNHGQNLEDEKNPEGNHSQKFDGHTSTDMTLPEVKLNASSLPLQLKKSTTALKVKSKTDTDSVIKWISSKPQIATVNQKTGKITAKKVGTAYISVIMKSGARAKCKIVVQKKAVKTKKITLNAKSRTLKLKGRRKTFQITLVKTPLTSLEKITYQSSDKKVATVSRKGKITAKKAGKAVITVKVGKKRAKIKVTVKK